MKLGEKSNPEGEKGGEKEQKIATLESSRCGSESVRWGGLKFHWLLSLPYFISSAGKSGFTGRANLGQAFFCCTPHLGCSHDSPQGRKLDLLQEIHQRPCPTHL